jgi:hypothetical protein
MRTQYERRLRRLEERVERRPGEISEAHREFMEQEFPRLQALLARLEQWEEDAADEGWPEEERPR